LFRDPVVIYKANSIKLFSSRILTLNPFREIKIRFGWEASERWKWKRGMNEEGETTTTTKKLK
jgi:hypothetical protein